MLQEHPGAGLKVPRQLLSRTARRPPYPSGLRFASSIAVQIEDPKHCKHQKNGCPCPGEGNLFRDGKELERHITSAMKLKIT